MMIYIYIIYKKELVEVVPSVPPVTGNYIHVTWYKKIIEVAF